jgi:hypothetical protein
MEAWRTKHMYLDSSAYIYHHEGCTTIQLNWSYFSQQVLDTTVLVGLINIRPS